MIHSSFGSFIYIEALELFVSVADLCCQVYDSLSHVARLV
jgi:hypothetical protein